jgi:hypothetical protein
VCSSRTRSRARAPIGLRLCGIAEQLAVGAERLVGVVTTSSSFPGSNQRSIPSYGFETIAAPAAASSNGRHDDEAKTVACERRVM